MLNFAPDLKWTCSTPLIADVFGPGTSIWRCGLHSVPTGVGFWVGQDPSFFSYLALAPTLLGGLKVLEAKKAWTDPERRREGMGKALLLAAMREAPVLSDRDGMTPGAYALWMSLTSVRHRWWDTRNNRFVAERHVPPPDRFDIYAGAARWLLVLDRPLWWRLRNWPRNLVDVLSRLVVWVRTRR